MYSRIFSALFALALVVSGCSDDRVLTIDTKGAVFGVAYLDRNGNGQFETPVDTIVPGVVTQFAPVGGGVARTATSGALGGFLVTDLLVGEYDVSVDLATVPDSLTLIKIDSTRVRVIAGDTVTVGVALSFPRLKVRDARAAATGRRVFVEGIALNSWNTYGDSTLHVADTSGVIRATRVATSPVVAGQSVRVLGTVESQGGQPTLTTATAFVLGPAQLPPPTAVTTSKAATADQGKLDAALVQVTGATILGSQTLPSGDVLLTVNDDSGLLEVLIDRNVNIPTPSLIPGALLDATGLLVPSAEAGKWWLKPRAAGDLTVTFPSATIAEARALALGKIVSVEGTALTGFYTFADGTVHLADATAAIRAINVAAVQLFPGDRARILGTLTFRDGQPVLNTHSVSVLGPGVLPLPTNLSTQNASGANGGNLDANLAKVTNATIADTATVGADFRMRVNDGSGVLEVVLDRDAGFQFTPFSPGVTLDITGVLVPITAGGAWRLKPRLSSGCGGISQPPCDIIVR